MIALDPQQTFDVTFDFQAALPFSERRILICRHLTARQCIQIDELTDRAELGTVKLPERVKLLSEAIAIGAVAWKNPAEPFDAAKLPDLLTIDELWELALACVVGSRLSEKDKKKSALQSASAAQATSAAPAAAGA